MHIDICVSTFRRAAVLDALRSLDAQRAPDGVSLAIIVADNDETPSAQADILVASQSMRLPVTYIHAPSRNISIARNACLDAARGPWVAFFDDDEVAPPDWISKLYTHAVENGLDAVFGPAIAQYPKDTPAWIRARDYHSNWPEQRGGVVQTGHTCNALMNMTSLPFANQRFLLEKGRTGGEDTEYFFRAWRGGAKLGIALDAVVYEPADPARMSLAWIRRRKFRSGISYGRHSMESDSLGERLQLLVKAGAKCLFSGIVALAYLPFQARRNYWFLRAVFHAGACSAVIRVREQELYG